jgi:hypothetical protein
MEGTGRWLIKKISRHFCEWCEENHEILAEDSGFLAEVLARVLSNTMQECRQRGPQFPSSCW